MKRFLDMGCRLLAVSVFAAVLSGCEVETMAFGKVTNAKTGAPVEGAHVMEVSVTKKEIRMIDETYTDSLGNFSLGGGLAGFGPRKVSLQIIVERDSFATAVLENDYSSLNISLIPNR